MIEALLTPISDKEPSGPDLEYDGEHMALAQAVRGKPEQQYGDTIIPPQEPNWLEVRGAAEKLLSRSKDLRVALIWLRASTRVDGYPGFADGLALVQRLLEAFWDGVHPALETGDEEPAAMRLNVLSGLADPAGLLGDLRQAPLVGPAGAKSIRVRDLELALSRAEPASGEVAPTEAGVRSGLSEALGQHRDLAAPLLAADRSVASIASILEERAAGASAPNLGPLRTLTRLVADAAKAAVDALDAASGGTGPGVVGQPGPGTAGLTGAIRSRDDASRVLDQVCEWLSQAEPTNPAPLVIRRAQRLMKMGFLEIIRDVAPAGVDQVVNLIGEDRNAQ